MGFWFLFPLGGLGFVEELALEKNGADGAAERGGVLLEGLAFGFGEAAQVRLDLRGCDLAVPGAGDDGVGGVEWERGEEEECGGAG